MCHIIVSSTFAESLTPRRDVTGIKFRYIRSRYKYPAETDVDDKRERRGSRTMYQTAVNPTGVSTRTAVRGWNATRRLSAWNIASGRKASQWICQSLPGSPRDGRVPREIMVR